MRSLQHILGSEQDLALHSLAVRRRVLSRVQARVRKFTAILRVPMYRHALRYGAAAAVEHDAVPFRHEFRLVLDVGANRGQFALVAARRFPQAALMCFEPLSEPRATLERALHWHRNLEVIACAVSAHAGEAEFVISRADDSSSLLPMTEAQTQHFPGTGAAARTVVPTAPLDHLVVPERRLRPCLLKVDVQGAELDVLDGAPGVLRAVDSVLVECSFVELYRGQALAGEIIDALHGRGFLLTAVCSPLPDRSGGVLQADLLFERRS